MKNAMTATRFDSYASGVRALVRTGRAGTDSVVWDQPAETRLYLQRDGRGVTCALTLLDMEFAEFDPRFQEEADGTLVGEDYYLRVLEVRA